jgi:uncharacterized membrane protein
VFAIAITLLVLELKVPELEPGETLFEALTTEHFFASYVAYFLSFVSILVMWVNHHRIFTLVRRSTMRSCTGTDCCCCLSRLCRFQRRCLRNICRWLPPKAQPAMYRRHRA